MNPNPQQEQVINHVDGPALVIAVPGSGKTTVVTERTKKLVHSGKPPSSILCITFTNKAADEMKSRISKVLGTAAKYIVISTFHSLCAQIVRENADAVGLKKSYSIYDQDDQRRLMKRCIFKVLGEEFALTDNYLNDLVNCIEWQRNKCLSKDEAYSKFRISEQQAEVIDTYFSELRAANAIDFTGLITETNNLLETNTVVRDYYRNKWKYISVDEVQDTCVAQYKLVIHLGGGHKNVLVVGDIDQSLYRFRGASPENILSFEREFQPTIYKLEKNYRSTPEILGPSHALITHNKMRKDAELITDNPNGEEPFVIHCPDEEQMVQILVAEVRRHLAKGIRPEQVAILYRTNYLSRCLEFGMKMARIPYKIIGGLSFWDRKEIKASLSILKFMSNPQDQIAFSSTLEACCKGVGDKIISGIIDNANQNKIPLLEAARQFSATKKAAAGSVKQFLDQVDSKDNDDLKMSNIVNKTGFALKMSKNSSIEQDRMDNVKELISDFQKALTDGTSLSGYLQNISLLSASDIESQDGLVNLMTTHAAKGLEFDLVVISHGMEDIMPHKRVLELKHTDIAEYIPQLEEERRIFYVAMTRAKKHLRVFTCQNKFGQEFEKSRFIDEAGLLVEERGDFSSIRRAPRR